jgi:sulfide:quinone oxidoreductase
MSSPSPTSQRVAVLGSSFAGMTAALELRKQLDARHEVVVLDPRDHFTFIPSLIWLPFGARKAEDITFPLAPLYERKGIEFVNEAAAGVDVGAHTVTTASGATVD